MFEHRILVVDHTDAFYKSDYFKDAIFIQDPVEALAYLAVNPVDAVVFGKQYELMDGMKFIEASRKIIKHFIGVNVLNQMDDKEALLVYQSNIDLVYSKDRDIDLLVYLLSTLVENKSEKQNILYGHKDNIKVHLNAFEVYKDNERIDLTPKEFEILTLLMHQNNKVMARSDIIESVWEDPAHRVDERTIDVHIRRLREKLNTHSIISIRGVGYKWSDKR